ncbi:MAG: hypothetical protein U9R37_01715 [Campylobacterota bacterium]|nr:hypothetical protein [Campylobacterota bacterium]
MQNIIYEYEEVNNDDLKNHIINTALLHKYFSLEWKTLRGKK